MAEEEISEVAAYLVEALDLTVPEQFDPLLPTLLIQALVRLFPSSSSAWREVQSSEDPEEQWSAVVQFIESSILNNNPLEIQGLGLQEILDIYTLVGEYTQQLLESNGQSSSEKLQKQSKKNEIQPEKSDKKKISKPKSNKSRNKSANLPSRPQKITKSPPKKEKINKTQRQKVEEPKSHEDKKEKKIQKQSSLGDQLLLGIQKNIAKNIHKKNPKTSNLFKDPQSLQAVAKAKRQFTYFLKDYQRSNKQIKEKANLENRKNNGKVDPDQHFLKSVEKKHKVVQQAITNEEIKYFMALRDRKLAFVNKIHRLTEQLQKQRQLEWDKRQKEMMEQQRRKVSQQITKTQGVFQKNMQLLREQYEKTRERRAQESNQEIDICREMSRAVQKRKLEQMQVLRVLWQQQNAKLSSIIGDEQAMQKKLIDIYRRNRP